MVPCHMPMITTPNMPNYKSSELIYQSIVDFERESTEG